MEIFKFDKSDITRHIEYELKTLSKFKEPLNYIIKSLEKLGNSKTITSLKKVDLNKIKEKEGKNYHWSTFTYKNVTLVIRRYGSHLTIFTKVIKDKREDSRYSIEYGAFTLNTDFKKFGDKQDEMADKYYDKPFTGLNLIIKDLLLLLIDKGVHWVWNSVSLKRPDHIKIELAFDGNSINSLDNFAFCMEEIDNIYLTLFAETTMLKKLKEYKDKTGESLNKRYKVGKVSTEVKDEYYHSAGIELIDTMGKESKSFQDIYSLTRYHFEDIFKDKIFLYNGELYVEGGKFKVGEAVAYKNIREDDDEKVTSFQATFPKENFIPLKKY
jgi:hypothetical protein